MTEAQARITLQQLGGTSLLKLMIGAKNFTFDSTGETGLRFKFECSSVANLVDIKLKNDLYVMRFYKIVPLMINDGNDRLTINPEADFEPMTAAVFEDIYDDQLVDIFEAATGLIIRRPDFVAI